MTDHIHTDPTTSMLRQMLVDNDEKHEEAHKRLRYDWRDHDRRLDRLEEEYHLILQKLGKIEQSLTLPRDVSTLRLTVGQTILVVIACLSIAGGWAATGVLAAQTSSQMASMNQKVSMTEVKVDSLKGDVKTLLGRSDGGK